MGFSTDLDKYLTTPPEDNSNYFEAVYEGINDSLPETLSNDLETVIDEIIGWYHIKGFDVPKAIGRLEYILPFLIED